MREKPERSRALRGVLILIISLLLFMVFSLLMPEKFPQTVSAIGFYLAEVLWILPGVLILAGLLLVWFPRELVVKYLGETSGAKGFLLSIVLGMLPTGPAYLAFPIAAALLKRGARIANVVIFLSAWSCIKLPQELVELQFLGLEFMTVRLLLTAMLVIPAGLIVEKACLKLQGKAKRHGKQFKSQGERTKILFDAGTYR